MDFTILLACFSLKISGTQKMMGLESIKMGEGCKKLNANLLKWGYSITTRVRPGNRNRFPLTGWGAFRGVRPFSMPATDPAQPISGSLKRLLHYCTIPVYKAANMHSGIGWEGRCKVSNCGLINYIMLTSKYLSLFFGVKPILLNCINPLKPVSMRYINPSPTLPANIETSSDRIGAKSLFFGL